MQYTDEVLEHFMNPRNVGEIPDADGIGTKCCKNHEGYRGTLHGGVLMTIFDGAMGNCKFARGLTAVTVEMTTRFRNPVFTEREATVLARITRSSHPLYLLEAEIVQDGIVKATAKAKFYDQPKLADELEECR